MYQHSISYSQRIDRDNGTRCFLFPVSQTTKSENSKTHFSFSRGWLGILIFKDSSWAVGTGVEAPDPAGGESVAVFVFDCSLPDMIS
jgi:hypothetical protein